MPKYHVTSPDGRTIEVNAPEGATEEQAIKYAKDNWDTLSKQAPAPQQAQPAQPERPFSERVMSNVNNLMSSARKVYVDPLIGAVETPAALATGLGAGALGGIAQLGTAAYEAGKEMLGGQSTPGVAHAVGQDVAEKFTYQPRTEFGQAATRAAGEVMSGFGLFPYLAEKARTTEQAATGGRSYLTDVLGGAAAAAPVLGAGKFKEFKEKGLADKQEELNIKQRMNAPTDQIRNAMQAPDKEGLKFITPSEKGVEAQYGALSSKTNQSISAVNEEAATRMAANEIGLPKDQPFTPETIATKVEEANKAYENLVEQAYGALPPKPSYTGGVSMGTMAPKMESPQATIRQTPEFRNAIEGEKSRLQAMISGNKSAFQSLSKAIPILEDELKNLKQDPQDVLNRIRTFRQQAKDTFQSKPNDIEREGARAKMFLANKLEDLLEQNLAAQGKPGLVKQMREARRKLAQIHAVEDSLTVDGKLSIKRMAEIDKKTGGSLLTGNLKRIATMGQKYPLGAQDIKGPVTPLSYFDAILGTASLAAGHAEGMALVAGKALVPTLAKIGKLQSKTPDYVAKPSISRSGTTAAATGAAASQAEEARKRRKQERAK